MLSPLTTRRILLTALVSSAAITACDQPHAPVKTHQALPPVLVAIDGTRLQGLCAALDGVRAYAIYYGCVLRDYTNGRCLIFTEPNPPAWLLKDEQAHCLGGSHEH